MPESVTMKWRGVEATAAERAGAARGLTLWAEHVLQQSVEIVPLLEGTLERSGAVSPANAESLTAAVSYDTPYAVRQHEDLTYHHPNGRQAKYLETPLNASVDTGKALVAEEIHAALTGGPAAPVLSAAEDASTPDDSGGPDVGDMVSDVASVAQVVVNVIAPETLIFDL